MEETNRHFHIAGNYIDRQYIQTQNIYTTLPPAAAGRTQNRNNPDIVDADYVPVSDCCPYLDIRKLREESVYQPLEFENMLQKSAENDAGTLAAFLNKYRKLGYLDFHGDSKRQIYQTLRTYFPTMRPYSYQNFAAYF